MLDELRRRIDSNDRFLFYWSVHGIDIPTGDGKGQVGFLPVAKSREGALSTMVSMDDLRRWNNLISARQSLFLLDACFSGLAAIATQSNHRDLTLEQLARPSHHLISAGTGKEQTIASSRWGGSIFTRALLDGLRGGADTQNAYPRDGVVSLTELIAYMKTRIVREKDAADWTLTPQLRDLRANEGEFFFITKDKKLALAKQQGQPTGAFKHGQAIVTMGAPALVPMVSAAAVKEAQEVLTALGYNPGTADGIPGIRTRGALQTFQRQQRLPATGTLDQPTQLALAEAWSRLTNPTPAPAPRATTVASTSPRATGCHPGLPALATCHDRLKDRTQGPHPRPGHGPPS